MGTQVTICRLCLNICVDFRAIEGHMKDVLVKVLPNIDLPVIREPVVCTNCAEMLTKCFDFKVIRFYINDNKVSFVDKDRKKLDVKDVDLHSNEYGTDFQDQNFCGFCIGLVKDFSVSVEVEKGDVTLDAMIGRFLPELDLSIIRKSVICASCRKSLEKCFHFVTNCLIVEKKIKRYCETLDLNSRGQIELSSILESISRNVREIEIQTCEKGVINEGDTLDKLEQSFCDDTEYNRENVEHKNKSFVDTDNLTLDNEEQFISRCKEDSNVLDVIKREETFCKSSDTELKIEDFDEMENPTCLVNEEIEIKTEESDFHRLEYGVVIPREMSTKLRRVQKSLISDLEGCQSKPHIKRTSTNKNVYTKRMYQCDCCSFQTKHKKGLKIHSRRHKSSSEIPTNQCNPCSYQTVCRIGDLRSHSLKHKNPSDVPIYKCISCSFQTKNNKDLKTHMLKHKDPPEVTMYKCHSCSYKTKQKHYLKKHSLKHKDPSEVTMHKCDSCPFETKYEKSLKGHLLLHKNPSEVTMYKCDSCSFQTKHKQYIKGHLLLHKDPLKLTMYKCESCSFQTKDKYYIKDHLLLHNDPSGVTMYKCASCSFQTRRKSYLKIHLLKHKDPSEVTMYKCASCSLQTTDKLTLKQHLLLHKNPSEVRVYECDSCSFQTRYVPSLRNHLRIHKDSSEVTMYKCDSCSFETKHKKCLIRHLLVHKNPSEVTMYKCDSCLYRTTRKYYLNKHLLKHKDLLEVKTFKCESCSFEAHSLYVLRKHLPKHKDP